MSCVYYFFLVENDKLLIYVFKVYLLYCLFAH